MASALNHPHILTVHEAGEFGDRQYLVTELVDGGTLADWARDSERTWRQVVTLLVGIADALAAAHDAGIMHRDVKPANILIAKNGYAKLGDFGLAKLDATLRAMSGRARAGATRPGVVVGTVAYMSPEQAAGKPLDTRSDIFSLGLLLYELLAGRRAFTGTSDVDALHAMVRRKNTVRSRRACQSVCVSSSRRPSRRTRPNASSPCASWSSICGARPGDRANPLATPRSLTRLAAALGDG